MNIHTGQSLTTEFFPGKIVKNWSKGNQYFFQDSGGVILCVESYTDDIIRIRFTVDGIFENDFSYGIFSKFEKTNHSTNLTETNDSFILSTSTTKLKIDKLTFKHTFFDMDDRIICADEKGFHWEEFYEKGGNIVQMSKVALSDESYYGLGDKPTKLNIRGHRFHNWGTDTYGFAEDSDPIYRNIPFQNSFDV